MHANTHDKSPPMRTSASVTVLLLMALCAVAHSPSKAYADTTWWDCYHREGKFLERISIDWGHTPGDATWACNQWVSRCEGNCKASGNANRPEACDAQRMMDGCSFFEGDAWINRIIDLATYKEVFRDACNTHDACFYGPWQDGTEQTKEAYFAKCNDLFHQEMQWKCDDGWRFLPVFGLFGLGGPVGCLAAAEAYMLPKDRFWKAFTDQQERAGRDCSF